MLQTFSGSFTVGESGGNRGFSKSLAIGSAMTPSEWVSIGISDLYTDGSWLYLGTDNTGTYPHAMHSQAAQERIVSLKVNGVDMNVTSDVAWTNGRRWLNPLFSLDLIPASGTCNYEIVYDDNVCDLFLETTVGSSVGFTGYSDGSSTDFDIAGGALNQPNSSIVEPVFVGTDTSGNGHPFVIGYASQADADAAPFGFVIPTSVTATPYGIGAKLQTGASNDGTAYRRLTTMPPGLGCRDSEYLVLNWMESKADLIRKLSRIWNIPLNDDLAY